MKIHQLLESSSPCFSFEFFPPKTEEGSKSLFRTLEDLAPLDPGFVSVTYGAGGSAREKTLDLVHQIKQRSQIETMAHLTCVGHTADELAEILDRLADQGIENILPLRGDPPRDKNAFLSGAEGFSHASELVNFIRSKGYPFCLATAGYPEGHLESPTAEGDLFYLKEKVEAGADFVVTQLFFDNAFYFDFVDRVRRAGIKVPIVPGIMPISNFEQIQRFIRLCGATLPMRLLLQLEKVKNDPEAVMQLGIAHATVQCVDLLKRGAPGIHFYTLNRSPATRMIVSALKT